MSSWRDFIGLPHETGADPRIGAAADCLLLVFAVQDELGIPHPEPEEHWFDLARRGGWHELKELYDTFFSCAEGVEGVSRDGDFALLLSNKRGGMMGFATRIDGGTLTVSEKRGVIWIPDSVKEWNRYYRWKA